MKSSNNPSAMGKKIYKFLEKDKILLLQDKAFPSIVSKIVGEKISGSWWGHPMANPIYNGLGWMEHNQNILTLKLLDGKVTYIHESLFSDIYALVKEPRDWQFKKLGDDENKLLKYILKKDKVLSDDPKLKELVKDTKKSFATLEKRLLVYSSEEHTESGKHIKEFMSWHQSKIFSKKPTHYEESLAKLNKIIHNLSLKSKACVKLPWP